MTSSAPVAALVADARDVLLGFPAASDGQHALRDRYVAHLDARPDGVLRTCRPDHLTASTVVLSADASRVLLTLHAKAGRWFQLGGHAEPGDGTLLAAARREVVEESGLDVALDPVPVHLDEHAVPFCGSDGVAHHLDVRFVAVAPDGARHAVSDESLDVRWWPVDDLPNPDLAPMVALAVARVRAGQEAVRGSR
ncbi:NUDIX hydrolase [Krasilnikoviella flava]|uniref:8-oxo-dGTP pyrophosphatase MutT, NUDIX family n=1 Tax=Krasilnikoviella flava TaxID=526729 RepID=A0A1T5KQM0_9MICO|nr:NUDIX hydrolase [Krasilnikoviella flava]SKC65941.1 8-oxo-dGTP pyrophosphatase MutT, NUDIX family [Krasilnikoviella flava]